MDNYSQMGGPLRANPGRIGLKDRSNWQVDAKGYALQIKCRASSQFNAEGHLPDDPAFPTSLKKNTWYLLEPAEKLLSADHKVTYFVSPTLDLIAEGTVRHALFVSYADDISIYFRPHANINLNDVEFHIQVLAVEGVE